MGAKGLTTLPSLSLKALAVNKEKVNTCTRNLNKRHERRQFTDETKFG
jgi:hypothetical protein